MPHLVQMQEQHGKDGLVVMTINIDSEKAAVRRAADFLAEKKVNLINLAWDGDFQAWARKVQYDGGVPHYVIYNREGKLVFGGFEAPEFIDRMVLEQLKK